MMTDYRFDDGKIFIIFNETNQPIKLGSPYLSNEIIIFDSQFPVAAYGLLLCITNERTNLNSNWMMLENGFLVENKIGATTVAMNYVNEIPIFLIHQLFTVHSNGNDGHHVHDAIGSVRWNARNLLLLIFDWHMNFFPEIPNRIPFWMTRSITHDKWWEPFGIGKNERARNSFINNNNNNNQF